MIRIIVFFIISYPTILFSQTTVIAKITQRGIYVGADSRMTGFNYRQDGKTDTLYWHTCKIITAGKFNFALIGAYPQISRDEALKICSLNTTLDEVIKIFVDTVTRKIVDKLEAERLTSLTGYQRIITQIAPLLSQVIFFGYENGKPILKEIRFTLISGLFEAVKVRYTVITGQTTIYAGHCCEILYTRDDKKTWRHNKIKIINRLIGIEIKANPLFVGGPIDIIKVTPKGTTWIQKKFICK